MSNVIDFQSVAARRASPPETSVFRWSWELALSAWGNSLCLQSGHACQKSTACCNIGRNGASPNNSSPAGAVW